ncbi:MULTISPECIES: hypothetical protein [unclassified Nostoc]|nr:MULTISPECIES: hypothetical protein [unclassified Nostoc]MDZ8126644.1 hypothetical protein [Nostoc sp. CmiVER01]MDZ8227868.1 hypothetical protein [Nostoc sp. ChiVER01]
MTIPHPLSSTWGHLRNSDRLYNAMAKVPDRDEVRNLALLQKP